MRVALDATPLALTTGGLTRYTAELSRALADRYPESDFVLISDQAFTMPEPLGGSLRAGGRPRGGHRAFPRCGVGRGSGAAWGFGCLSSHGVAGGGYSAVFSLRGYARTAKEPRRVGRSVARGAPPAWRGPCAGRPEAGGFQPVARRARVAGDGRSQRYRSGAALLRRAGIGLPFLLRRLRPAGARGHAVRGVCA